MTASLSPTHPSLINVVMCGSGRREMNGEGRMSLTVTVSRRVGVSDSCQAFVAALPVAWSGEHA